MDFCFNEMVGAFCDKTLPLQKSSWCWGEGLIVSAKLATSLTSFQVRTDSAVTSTPNHQVSPDYISTCVQLSRVQYVYSCLSFTYFFNSKLLTILSKFPFMKSIHNMTPPFFYIDILKNEYIKILILLECFQFFTFYMIIAFIDWLNYFERHGFYWHVVQ